MAKQTKGKNKATDDSGTFEEGDDSLILDMGAVEEQSFDLIPKGTYDAIIEEVEFKMSQSSNQPMWNLTLAITEGEFRGRKLFGMISFSPKALPGSKAAIRKIAPELLEGVFDVVKIAKEGLLNGKKLRVKTKIEAYDGEDRTRIAAWLAPKDSDGFEE